MHWYPTLREVVKLFKFRHAIRSVVDLHRIVVVQKYNVPQFMLRRPTDTGAQKPCLSANAYKLLYKFFNELNGWIEAIHATAPSISFFMI